MARGFAPPPSPLLDIRPSYYDEINHVFSSGKDFNISLVGVEQISVMMGDSCLGLVICFQLYLAELV